MADGDEEDHLHLGLLIRHPASSCSTLPENHSALSLLHQLDHFWFRDNILCAPSFCSCLPFRPPSSPPRCPSSPQREPFRSIELAQFSNSGSSQLRKSITSELPCAHFEKLQRRCIAEEARENSIAHRSTPGRPRRPRKQLGDIRVPAPRQCLSEIPYSNGTEATGLVQVPVSDTGRALRVGSVDRQNGKCESSLHERKLQRITSGKHLGESFTDSRQQDNSVKRWLRRERRRSSKSMTDLEVDELQGFMDLGFDFSKDELTPHVVNMFPALQRQLRGQVGGGSSPEVTILETKPFWSDSWWMQRPASPLLNWRIPAQAEGSEDMKKHLKFWARAVASTVRQEC